MSRGLLALILLQLAACAAPSPAVSLAVPAQQPPAKEYVDELKRFTRHGHVIYDFDDAMAIDATFHAPEFQEAYAAKWAEVYKLDRAEAERVRAQLMAQATTNWEFYAETSAHNYEINDLASYKTVWRVTLVSDTGKEVVAREIKPAKELRAMAFAFYPYATVFSKGWRIKFPNKVGEEPLVTPDTKKLTLRLAGPQGSIDLVWKLK